MQLLSRLKRIAITIHAARGHRRLRLRAAGLRRRTFLLFPALTMLVRIQSSALQLNCLFGLHQFET